MRPTYLGLRSPKDRTEFTADPHVSHHGTKLFHEAHLNSPARSPNSKTYAFAPSNRFFYYKYSEYRMPPNLGPGAYNPD